MSAASLSRWHNLFLVLLLQLGLALPTLAHDYQAGTLQIDHPSSVATPPGSPNGVAYLSISNEGEQSDRWLSATSSRADRVQLHQSIEQNGMRSMEHIEFPVELAPGSALELQPGGYHLMLMGLQQPLQAGERAPLTLTFEKAGEVQVELHVEGLDRQGDGHSGH